MATESEKAAEKWMVRNDVGGHFGVACVGKFEEAFLAGDKSGYARAKKESEEVIHASFCPCVWCARLREQKRDKHPQKKTEMRK